jgi:hypothetical protein
MKVSTTFDGVRYVGQGIRPSRILRTQWGAFNALSVYRQKQTIYICYKHIVPHDAAAHEYSTGLSIVEVARNHRVPLRFHLLALMALMQRATA